MFSKFLPSNHGRSFYDDLRGRDDHFDIEDRAGLLDQENLNHSFQDYELDQAEGLGLDDSRATMPPQMPSRGRRQNQSRRTRGSASGWGGNAPHDDEGDNDVPASLLVERHDGPGNMLGAGSPSQPQFRENQDGRPTAAIPGPSRARAQWETTQARQRLHNDDDNFGPRKRNHTSVAGKPNLLASGRKSGDAKNNAEWRWANISNLDIFIHDVYEYYRGCGLRCILVERALHLVKVAFTSVLLTFLTQCIDFSKLRDSKRLSQVIVPQCTRKMSWMWNLGLWLFAFYFIWKLIQYLLDLRRLMHVREFYIYLLNVPDEDMQTATWQEIVARIMALRDLNTKTATSLTDANRRYLGSQSKERLDASDIANRIMRRDNYMIALINKDVLDLTIPLPIPFLKGKQLWSNTLEWMLEFSLMDMVFNEQGQVHQDFLKADRRGVLSAKLRQRFIFSAVMVLIFAPFVAGYLIIVNFLTYYNEIQKNPSFLSSRTYTPLAEWKFREFNELPHLFRKRLDMSHPFASHYIDQFPKVATDMVAKVVAFMSGSLATVLAVVSVWDPEMFLAFEITPDRTVLFYTALFGSIWAATRGSISADNAVFDPEYALRNVVEYTHYLPDHWRDRGLHSPDVKAEFGELYKPKVLIFLEEILSIVIMPFVLFFSLPKSSDRIIDFFREFTIHVDGLGYVCSFAEFDFKKNLQPAQTGDQEAGGVEDGGAEDVRDEYYSTKHGKMEASFYGFMGNYGTYGHGNVGRNPPILPAGAAFPSHLPPGMRQQFHPPPAWPPGTVAMSPTALPSDSHHMLGSRMGRSEHLRARSRGGPGGKPFVPPQPSPMQSILLDPHHQPSNQGFGPSRGVVGHHHHNPSRQHRGGPGGYHQEESNIIEESAEEGAMRGGSGAGQRHQQKQKQPQGQGREDVENSMMGGEEEDDPADGHLDASAWQTSPIRGLSRANSGIDDVADGKAASAPDAGVVHMIYQFNQAQLNRRPGGLR